MLECDEIFVVCDIARAKTDAGVMRVFELANQARLEHVGIVCTKSDVRLSFNNLSLKTYSYLYSSFSRMKRGKTEKANRLGKSKRCSELSRELPRNSKRFATTWKI